MLLFMNHRIVRYLPRLLNTKETIGRLNIVNCVFRDSNRATENSHNYRSVNVTSWLTCRHVSLSVLNQWYSIVCTFLYWHGANYFIARAMRLRNNYILLFFSSWPTYYLYQLYFLDVITCTIKCISYVSTTV